MIQPRPDPVQLALEASRRELLDLGLKNPLVSHRPSRVRGVDVVDELSAEVYRVLVREGQPLTFLPAAREVEPSGPLSMPQPGEKLAEARQRTRRLKTSHGPIELQRRLLRTEADARTSLEEHGVNALFLALGRLYWPDTERGPLQEAPLLLVPVRLSRASAVERFFMEATHDDPVINLAVSARLERDFGFGLPPFEPEEDTVTGWMDAVEALITGRPSFALARDEQALDLFSLGRLWLYRDLESGPWGDAPPWRHRVVRALLGDGFDAPPPAPRPDLAWLEVQDADPSQAEALSLAAAGGELVIQGPPGTGKSQTITHLIAQAVARGQRVLVVAEKQAALLVQKRRLDALGLGELCLELHSHLASRRVVVDELAQTLVLGAPLGQVDEAVLAERDALADALDDYHLALTEPLGRTEVSPYEAAGWLAQRGSREPVRLPFGPLAHWDAAERAKRRAVLVELEARVLALGVLPATHPLAGVGLTRVVSGDKSRLQEWLTEAQEALERQRQASATLAEALHQPAPGDRASAAALVELAELLAQAPELAEVPWGDPAWESEAVDEALVVLDRIEALTRELPTLRPEAIEGDRLATESALELARLDLLKLSGRWWRMFSWRYHKARALARSLNGGVALPTPQAAIRALEVTIGLRTARRALARHGAQCARLFARAWRGWSSTRKPLAELTEWVRGLRRRIGEGRLPAGLLTAPLPAGPQSKAATLSADARAAFERAERALLTLQEMLAWEGPAPLIERPFADVAQDVARFLATLDRLPSLVAFNEVAARACALGLKDAVALAQSWSGAGTGLVAAFEHALYAGVLARAKAERPALVDFDANRHAEQAARFRELDIQVFEAHRLWLAKKHHAGLPGDGRLGAMGRLRRELAKKSRHLTVRRLLTEAGEAVLQIKPVLLMSPLSVATHLAPEGPRFDLVIFEEASLIRPVDAMGAIARAKQVVVVGDRRQLPPPSLVEREDGEEASSGETESLLDLFIAAGAPVARLRWHYRSRHPSLFAVSNRLFYGDEVRLFPSPLSRERRPDVGLSVLKVEGTFDRASRTNGAEARAVAEAVMEHARLRPSLSLGVATLSAAQAELIALEVEVRRRAQPALEPFFGPSDEPFFIKSLEHVQGDERDVILVSVAYGRAPDGQILLNFGPLNEAGGERRLNVLVTRARLACLVFTHLEADDLLRSGANGIKALAAVLRYARLKPSPVNRVEPDQADPLSVALTAALAQQGLSLEGPIGAEGVQVDLAVVSPEEPTVFQLGVDLDVGDELRGESARDRERVRAEVLAGLGWRLSRVHALEMVQEPERAIKRVKDALARPAAPPRAQALSPLTRAASTALAVEPYERYEVPLPAELQRVADVSPERLVPWLAALVAVEGPIAPGSVVRRVVSASGASRVSPRLAAAVEAAVDVACAQGLVRIGTARFLWPANETEASVRDRCAAGLPRPERSPEAVAPEERAAALVFAVRTCTPPRSPEDRLTGPFAILNLPKEAVLVEEASRVLGLFKGDGHALLAQDLAALVADGTFVDTGNGLRLA